jgi:putative transposase
MAKNATEGFSKELLDQLLAGRDPKTVLDSSGLIGDLKKVLADRMLNAEMDVHLDSEAEAGLANHRKNEFNRSASSLDAIRTVHSPRLFSIAVSNCCFSASKPPGTRLRPLAQT